MMTRATRPVGRRERAWLLAALLTLLFPQTAIAAPVFAGGAQSDNQPTVRFEEAFVWSAGHVSIHWADLDTLRDAGARGPFGFPLEAFVQKYLAVGLTTIEPPLPGQPVLETLEPTEIEIEPLPVADGAFEMASQPVPEPATSTLLGIALLLAAFVGGRR